jgi:FixJ family two-component response regulator
MPDCSGLDLQRYLNRINKKIPTVVITAFDDASIRERSRASGAKAFLTKPLHGPTLIDAIKTAIMAGKSESKPAENMRKKKN